MNLKPSSDEICWTGALQPLTDVAAAHGRSLSWWRCRRALWRADHLYTPDGRQAVTSDFVEFALSIDREVEDERRDRRLRSRRCKPRLKLVAVDGVQVAAIGKR